MTKIIITIKLFLIINFNMQISYHFRYDKNK